MAMTNNSLMVQIENKYHEVIGKLESFRSAFDAADPETQRKYQKYYDEALSQENSVRQRYNELSQRTAPLSGDEAHSVEIFFADIDRYLHKFRAETQHEGSLGWPEGLADSRTIDSKGWSEGYDSEK